MQKEGSKHRSIKSMLNKSFGIYYNVFKAFADTVELTSSNSSHCSELELTYKLLFVL